MEPLYYSVHMHSMNRKTRLSYSFLVQITGTLADARVSGAHARWAIDAAKEILRGHRAIVWDTHAGLYENPQIPKTTPKIAGNGCRVWILNGP
jgi:hypothetical protein